MKLLDKIWLKLARAIPQRLRYWVTIVSGCEATSGQWSAEEVPAVKFIDVLQRISK